MVLMIQANEPYKADIKAEYIGDFDGLDVYFVRKSIDLDGAKTGKCDLYVKEKYGAKLRSKKEVEIFLADFASSDKIGGYKRFEDENAREVLYLRLPNEKEREKIAKFTESRRNPENEE